MASIISSEEGSQKKRSAVGGKSPDARKAGRDGAGEIDPRLFADLVADAAPPMDAAVCLVDANAAGDKVCACRLVQLLTETSPEWGACRQIARSTQPFGWATAGSGYPEIEAALSGENADGLNPGTAGVVAKAAAPVRCLHCPVKDSPEHKHAELTLQQREAELRQVQRVAQMGSWFWDAATDVTTGSDELLRIFGFDPLTQRMPGFKDQRGLCFPEQDWERLNAAVRESMQTGVGYEMDLQALRNGVPIWITTRAEAVRNAEGRIVGLRGMVQDITSRKRVEDTLRFLAQGGDVQSEEFFHALARFLARTLNADYVCIDRLDEGSLTAETLAIYYDDKFDDNVRYTLKDTPCGQVVAESVCVFPHGVRHLFPRDAVLQEMLAESYVGTTLRNSQGQPIGLIAIIGRKPLADPKQATSVLQLAGVRAAAELERRDSEEALRTSREDLARAQSVGQMGWWRLDTRSNVLTWSDETYCLFGVPRQTPLTFEMFLSIVHPDDREYVSARWGAAVRGEPYDLEHRIIVDGQEKWIREKAYLERDSEGRLLGGFGIAQDITARKQAETALRQSLRRFELLVGTASELLVATDQQKAVEAVCHRVMEHIGCSMAINFLLDEASGRLHLNASAGLSPEQARQIEWLDLGSTICGSVARDGCRIVAEHISTSDDPRTELVKSLGVKAYACHPLLGPGARVIGTLSFGTSSRDTFSPEDLSLMKALSNQIAAAMVRLRHEHALRVRMTALDAAAEGVLITDRDGAIQYVNPAFSAFTGYSMHEAIGRTPGALVRSGAQDRAFYDDLWQTILGGRTWRGELVNRRKDGSLYPAELTVTPVIGPQKQIQNFIAIARDITKRKEDEQLLRKAKMELECRVAERTAQLASANADLRAQMAAYEQLEGELARVVENERVQLGIELHDSLCQQLAAAGMLTSSLARRLRDDNSVLADQATRIGAMLSQAGGDAHKMAHGLLPVQVEPTGLMMALSALVEQTKQIDGVRCIFECLAPVPVENSTTATYLFRIAQEAVHNALKHGRARRIVVTLSGEPHVKLTVRDDGIGIAASGGRRAGSGLRIMAHRARVIGADLCVGPAEGGGTIVECVVSQGEVVS